MFRIVKTDNHAFAASVNRGVNIVKGTGKVWTTRRGVVNAISDTILGYCGYFGNDACFDNLSIHGVAANYYIPVKDFVNEQERSKIKADIIGNSKGYNKRFADWLDNIKNIQIDLWKIETTLRQELYSEYLLAIEDKWTKVGAKSFTFN